MWEVITQNAKGKAWIVITSSLFAFLGQEHPNKMSDPGSDPWIASRTCSNIWISGTPMRCSFNMFFIFPTCSKARNLLEIHSARNCQNRLLSTKLPFGKSWNQSFPWLNYSIRQMSWFTQIIPNYPKSSQITKIFPQIPFLTQLSHHISCWTQLCRDVCYLYKLSYSNAVLALPAKVSRIIPVELCFAQESVVHPD